jgi:hypothetical protein
VPLDIAVIARPAGSPATMISPMRFTRRILLTCSCPAESVDPASLRHERARHGPQTP